MGPDERDAKRRGRQRWAVLESCDCTDLPAAGDFPQQTFSVPKKWKFVKGGADQSVRPIKYRRTVVAPNILDRLQSSSSTKCNADAAGIQISQRLLECI